MRTLLIPALAATMLTFSFGLAADAQEPAQTASAFAAMKDRDGQDRGTVTFTETKSGVLHVLVEMTGLPPGPHGFHVHATGACDAAGGFESAGPHYGDGEHGIAQPDGPHAGDFPNVHVGQDGLLKVEFFTERLSIGEGETPLMDADGSAVMIHAGPDDHTAQPGGDAGDRIACGIVQQPA
ncbi:MAG: superoxide dismutase family protein [Rhizobiaceae bacterium]